MKKILCPIDFSDTAQNGIAYAAKLAKASGSTLTLLNIQPSSSPVSAAENELLLNAVAERLEELGKEVRSFFKISCDAEILQSGGLLSDAIAHRGDDYSMIVMGTHGVENLIEFFRGSNTYNAIRRSKIPVLLVPRDIIYSDG